MNLVIRNEEPADYRAVEEAAREAFWNLYFPGCHEHYVIHKMRSHRDYIDELTFVLEVDNKIAGGIFFSRSGIVGEGHERVETITFGPVFILPEFHRRGFGRRLITHGIEAAQAAGFRAILTLGYPYHYATYGFTGGKKFGISMPDGLFYQGLLVLPLYEGALEGISGHAVFSDVFEVTQEEVDAYDKNFPYKEKKVQESQMEYEAAIARLEE